MRKMFAKIMIFFIRAYQVAISPFKSQCCRFHPSCSAYAIEAFKTHNPLKAFLLSFYRVIRCNPFGGHGYDPVPLPNEKKKRKEPSLNEQSLKGHVDNAGT